MRISRLRLRLAGGFALVLGLTLALFVTAGLRQQWLEAQRRFDARLSSLAVEVEHAIALRLRDQPPVTLADAAAEVARDWPQRADGFAVIDEADEVLMRHDPRGLFPRVHEAVRNTMADRITLAMDGDDARAIRLRTTLREPSATSGRIEVVAFDSMEGIERDTEQLTGTLLVVAPLIILLSLVGGYLLAGRALAPMEHLGEAIDAIAPHDLTARLPDSSETDEVAALTRRVNTLLERLEVARRRYQRFVREAAHQIRTPLTLVLGESSHALEYARHDPDAPARALHRVRVAAEQMRRRVDELLLFAEAESGTAFELDEVIELDDLALECTDLMRGRAEALGRTLALEDVGQVTVRGNAALLREALLELLENACRHGGPQSPVTVSTEQHGTEAHLVVTSALAPAGSPTRAGSGLGVAILEWIAAGHEGRLERTTSGDRYVARLVLKAV
jgi:signal transduction histidine kinase